MSSLRCTYSGGGDYHYFKGGEALNVHSLYVHGMIDQWAQNVDQGYVNGVSFIDMRKAFDAVNHSILLMKLKCLGCTERSLKLVYILSRIGGRSQYVSIKWEKSSTRAINYGVPQGSVLAPLLFSSTICLLVSKMEICFCLQTMQPCQLKAKQQMKSNLR